MVFLGVGAKKKPVKNVYGDTDGKENEIKSKHRFACAVDNHPTN